MTSYLILGSSRFLTITILAIWTDYPPAASKDASGHQDLVRLALSAQRRGRLRCLCQVTSLLRAYIGRSS